MFKFPWCSTHEPLSIDALIITTEGLIINEASVISALQHKLKFNLDLCWNKKFMGFHVINL